MIKSFSIILIVVNLLSCYKNSNPNELFIKFDNGRKYCISYLSYVELLSYSIKYYDANDNDNDNDSDSEEFKFYKVLLNEIGRNSTIETLCTLNRDDVLAYMIYDGKDLILFVLNKEEFVSSKINLKDNSIYPKSFNYYIE